MNSLSFEPPTDKYDEIRESLNLHVDYRKASQDVEKQIRDFIKYLNTKSEEEKEKEKESFKTELEAIKSCDDSFYRNHEFIDTSVSRLFEAGEVSDGIYLGELPTLSHVLLNADPHLKSEENKIILSRVTHSLKDIPGIQDMLRYTKKYGNLFPLLENPLDLRLLQPELPEKHPKFGGMIGNFNDEEERLGPYEYFINDKQNDVRLRVQIYQLNVLDYEFSSREHELCHLLRKQYLCYKAILEPHVFSYRIKNAINLLKKEVINEDSLNKIRDCLSSLSNAMNETKNSTIIVFKSWKELNQERAKQQFQSTTLQLEYCSVSELNDTNDSTNDNNWRYDIDKVTIEFNQLKELYGDFLKNVDEMSESNPQLVDEIRLLFEKISRFQNIYPPYAFRISYVSEESITSSTLSKEEIHRRQQVSLDDWKVSIDLDGFAKKSTKLAKANQYNHEVNFDERFDYQVSHLPESLILNIHRITRNSLGFVSKSSVAHVPIPIVSVNEYFNNTYVHHINPVLGWFKCNFNEISSSSDTGNRNASFSGAIFCAVDFAQKKDSSRWLDVAIEDAITIPMSNSDDLVRYNASKTSKTIVNSLRDYAFDPDKDFRNLLEDAAFLDPNDPINDSLLYIRNKGNTSKNFQSYKKAKSSKSNSFPFKSLRLKLQKLRSLNPILFSEIHNGRIPIEESEINAEKRFHEILKFFEDTTDEVSLSYDQLKVIKKVLHKFYMKYKDSQRDNGDKVVSFESVVQEVDWFLKIQQFFFFNLFVMETNSSSPDTFRLISRNISQRVHLNVFVDFAFNLPKSSSNETKPFVIVEFPGSESKTAKCYTSYKEGRTTFKLTTSLEILRDDATIRDLWKLNEDVSITIFDRRKNKVIEDLTKHKLRFLGKVVIPFQVIFQFGIVNSSFRLATPLCNYDYGFEKKQFEQKEPKESPKGIISDLMEYIRPKPQRNEANLSNNEFIGYGYDEFYNRSSLKLRVALEPFVDYPDASLISIQSLTESSVDESDHSFIKEVKEWTTIANTKMNSIIFETLRSLNYMAPNRQFKAFVTCSSGKKVLIPHFLGPQKPPKGYDKRACLHFVSRIPFIPNNLKFAAEERIDVWFKTEEILDNVNGMQAVYSIEHAIILFNYFTYLDELDSKKVNMFLILGRSLVDTVGVYVLVIDEQTHDKTVYNPARGEIYALRSRECPIQEIHCLVNRKGIYANIQLDSHPLNMHFDVQKSYHWQYLDTTSVETFQIHELSYRDSDLIVAKRMEDEFTKVIKSQLRKKISGRVA